MDMYMRRKCQECRLKKCLAVGMRPECVVPETQCAIKRKEKKAQKEKDKQQVPPSVVPVVTTTDTYKSEIPQLMKCDPPPHAECTVSFVFFVVVCSIYEYKPKQFVEPAIDFLFTISLNSNYYPRNY